jgi:flagellar protein FlgJ
MLPIGSLDALKSAAARDPKGAVREAAKQFEALFMQELMKSMRASTMASGMLDNGGTQLGTEMLDTQFATKLTGLPGGLADAIARQLERNIGKSTGMTPPKLAWQREADAASTASAAAKPTRIPEHGAAAFVSRHDGAAKAAERATGIPAHFMLGQAAHESGWGAKEIRHADGTPSHNLFGIKAGAGWTGAVAETTTTEFVDGQARKVVAKFRAYGSYDEAFRDYAKLLSSSPRYDAAEQAGSAEQFAQALQRGGYATDPAYADKLTRVINATLRLSRGPV